MRVHTDNFGVDGLELQSAAAAAGGDGRVAGGEGEGAAGGTTESAGTRHRQWCAQQRTQIRAAHAAAKCYFRALAPPPADLDADSALQLALQSNSVPGRTVLPPLQGGGVAADSSAGGLGHLHVQLRGMGHDFDFGGSSQDDGGIKLEIERSTGVRRSWYTFSAGTRAHFFAMDVVAERLRARMKGWRVGAKAAPAGAGAASDGGQLPSASLISSDQMSELKAWLLSRPPLAVSLLHHCCTPT